MRVIHKKAQRQPVIYGGSRNIWWWIALRLIYLIGEIIRIICPRGEILPWWNFIERLRSGNDRSCSFSIDAQFFDTETQGARFELKQFSSSSRPFNPAFGFLENFEDVPAFNLIEAVPFLGNIPGLIRGF